MNRYNAEGYIDLTAYEALSRIEREERKAKKAAAYRPLVYICSPYSHGCRRYSRFAVDTHYVPIAPHLLFPQFMYDGLGEDRQTAMFMNLVLLSKCAQLWVFGSVRSEGMQQEIKWAKRRHMTIRYFTEELEETE